MNWGSFLLVLSRVKISVPTSGQIIHKINFDTLHFTGTFMVMVIHDHCPVVHSLWFCPLGGQSRQVNTTSADNSAWRVQTFVRSSWWCDFPSLWYESFMPSLEQLAPPRGTIREQLDMSHISFHNDTFQKRRGKRQVFICWICFSARWSNRILVLRCDSTVRKTFRYFTPEQSLNDANLSFSAKCKGSFLRKTELPLIYHWENFYLQF